MADDEAMRSMVPGLQNLGNTCFFNAILQALASVNSFQEYLASVVLHARERGRATAFTTALKECLDALAPVPFGSSSRVVVPKLLNAELCKRLRAFRGNKQQDSQELLQFLMHLVHREQRTSSMVDHGLKDLMGTSMDTSNSWIMMANGAHAMEDHSSLCGSFHGVLGSNSSMVLNSMGSLQFVESLKEESWNPMHGLQVDLLRCETCQRSRPLNNHRFIDVSLSFDLNTPSSGKAVDLYHLLRKYTEAEMIEGVECSYCSIVDALEQTRREYQEALQAAVPDQQANGQHAALVDPARMEIEQHERIEYIHELEQQLLMSENQNGVHLDEIERRGWVVPRTLRRCSKRLMISRIPDVLCFHFNRKVFNPWSGSAKKIDVGILVPLELDMREFCVFEHGRPPQATKDQYSAGHQLANGWLHAHSMSRNEQTDSFKYQLTAVILHQGNERSGHFTCYRRASPTQWFYISDDAVREASVKEVRVCCAYLLFYERKHRTERRRSSGVFNEEEDDPFLHGGHIDAS